MEEGQTPLKTKVLSVATDQAFPPTPGAIKRGQLCRHHRLWCSWNGNAPPAPTLIICFGAIEGQTFEKEFWFLEQISLFHMFPYSLGSFPTGLLSASHPEGTWRRTMDMEHPSPIPYL